MGPVPGGRASRSLRMERRARRLRYRRDRHCPHRPRRARTRPLDRLAGRRRHGRGVRRGRRDLRRRARRPPGRGALLGTLTGRRHPRRRWRDHRVRPHRRPDRGGPAGRGRAAAGRGPRRRRRRADRRPRARSPPTAAATHLPNTVDKAAQARAPDPGRRRRPCRRGRHHPGPGRLRRQPPPHPRRQLRGPPRQDDQIRTRFNVLCVANGDTGMQTGYESLARTEGFEIFERHRVEDIARTGCRAARWPSSRPGPRPRARCRWCSPAAAAASCSTRPAATASKPTTS